MSAYTRACAFHALRKGYRAKPDRHCAPLTPIKSRNLFQHETMINARIFPHDR